MSKPKSKKPAKPRRSLKPLAFCAHLRVNTETGLPYFVHSRSGGVGWYLITDRPLRNKAGAWRSVSVVVLPREEPRRKGAKR